MVKGDVTPGKTVCICDWCGDEFTRRTADVLVSLRKGLGQFCCRSHATRFGNSHPSERKSENGRVQCEINRAKRSRRLKDVSPFRYFLRIIRNRRRPNGDHRTMELTLEDLRTQWIEQDGVCPYTGLKLVLPKNTAGFDDGNIHADRASLDRIDSSKGYVLGNVQFVSQMANFAKRDVSHDEMVRFCRAVATHWA